MTDTTAPPIGSTTRIPIADLIVDANIRKANKVPTSMASSIKQHGILVPVDAYYKNGNWHLQDGQLRYLAALDAGHTDLPVLVADPDQAEIARITRQLILNEQRNEITDSDRVGAYQTLFDLGATADQIARKTNAPKKAVEQGLAIAATPAGLEALEQGIGLDKAAIILEFADDPTTVQKLTAFALEDPDEFAYRVEEARSDLADTAEKQQIIAQLDLLGIPIIETEAELDQAIRLKDVYTDEKLTTPATQANTLGKGLVATVTQKYGHRDGKGWSNYWDDELYILDPTTSGFHIRPKTATGKEPLTEKQLAERRTTRENNKAWPIATTVRQAWILNELLTRKNLPNDLMTFVATALAAGHPSDTYGAGWQLAEQWLNLETAGSYMDNALLKELAARPARADLIALTIAVARAEAKIKDREAWRITGLDLIKLATYLNHLAVWGYNLSPVESNLVDAAKKAAR